ncbi:MAG: 23S rRNA pseudouridine(955/2504/2580) synthase RluC [Gammaproteobacteria bacterium]|jgi:23S rRNA pseudouridine955/2504/2580 synthase|nr:23S rRNA pseudouridine(955/2504/2580) synthase RluC [Gammaproteobacteria bacterium]
MPSSTQKNHSVQFIEITDSNAGQRLDNFLLSLEKGVPKSRIYRALRKGEVRVNKGRKKQTYKLQLGDTVRIPPLRVTEKTISNTVSDFLRQQLTESILHEDDDLLILNKPSGIAVHAGSGIDQGIIEALRIIRAELPFLELVHRLDRDTSGCLLLAKSRTSLLHLQQQMVEHDINKRYLTLLKDSWGQEEKTVIAPLLKNTVSAGERMVQVNDEGKYAETLFIPLQQFPSAQLTEVVLFTGRTHQIRVHAKHIGHPLAGDDKYGQRAFNKQMKKAGLKRLFLHAWKLGITHPNTNEALQIEAPIPMPLQTFICNMSNT